MVETVLPEPLVSVLREQSWAEAHALVMLQAETTSGAITFARTHRDMALAARDALLESAEDTVKHEFAALMRARLKERQPVTLRIDEIDRLLLKIFADQQEVARARALNWRNYRSRPAHAIDAVWKQQTQQLEAEMTYLKAKLASSPVLWEEPD